MVTILIMSAKNNYVIISYDVIIFVCGVNNKILSRDSNYNIDVVM